MGPPLLRLDKQLHMMLVIADRKDLDVTKLPDSARGRPLN